MLKLNTSEGVKYFLIKRLGIEAFNGVLPALTFWELYQDYGTKCIKESHLGNFKIFKESFRDLIKDGILVCYKELYYGLNNDFSREPDLIGRYKYLKEIFNYCETLAIPITYNT